MPSFLHGIITLFDSSFQELGHSLPPDLIESWSVMVHTVMSARGRVYHSPRHLLDISSQGNAIEKLAILFHDLVYLSIDLKIHPQLRVYLDHFQVGYPFQMILPEVDKEHSDRSSFLTYRVFDKSAGQILNSSTGCNEFLSAIVAGRVLGPYLTEWELIQVLSGIEATIPFRKLNDRDETPAKSLFRRLTLLSQELGLGVPVTEIQSTVKIAVSVGNRDVSGFAVQSMDVYLNNTWALLLENNPIFNNPMHTVIQYRIALQKALSFLEKISLETLFGQYLDEPSEEVNSALQSQAKKNIQFGQDYLNAKLLGAAVLEAVNALSGGEAPVALFIEEERNFVLQSIPAAGKNFSFKAEAYGRFDELVITSSQKEVHLEKNKILLHHLDLQTKKTSSLKFSLTSYLYRHMDAQVWDSAIQKSKLFFDSKMRPLEFLAQLPKGLLMDVFQAMQQVAVIRKDALSVLCQKIRSPIF